MKYKLLSLAFISLYSAQSFADTQHKALCNTVTYQAFGEPAKTVRDCAEDFEGFFLSVTVNNLIFTTMAQGLNIPQSEQEKYNGDTATLTSQITKDGDEYKVRIQATFNEQTINHSILMRPGQTKSVIFNGNKIIYKLSRQQ